MFQVVYVFHIFCAVWHPWPSSGTGKPVLCSHWCILYSLYEMVQCHLLVSPLGVLLLRGGLLSFSALLVLLLCYPGLLFGSWLFFSSTLRNKHGLLSYPIAWLPSHPIWFVMLVVQLVSSGHVFFFLKYLRWVTSLSWYICVTRASRHGLTWRYIYSIFIN